MKASRAKSRRGAVVVVVILCFLMITLICSMLLRMGLAHREQLALEERRLQSEWLVESGLERAASRLRGSSDYSGETWLVSAEELNGPWPGAVTIQVEKASDARRTVTVEAVYPKEGERRSRLRKQVAINLVADAERNKP